MTTATPSSPGPAPRAPSEHGGVFVYPPPSDWPRLVEANQRRLAESSATLVGELARDLSQAARAEVGRLAISADRNVDGAWLATGHQPELFHPGVWFKNFLLAGAARKLGASPINLIVDSDIAKGNALKLPGEGRVASLPFDITAADAPYEERRVLDETLFASVPDRFALLAAGWPFQPMLNRTWRWMLEAPSPFLSERFASARRRWEVTWGCHLADARMSQVCGTDSFARFAGHLLTNAERFRTVHNQAVAEYRRANGVRNANHPVPDLASDGDWTETPFWGWRTGATRRERLFVRTRPNRLELRLGTIGEAIATLTNDNDESLVRDFLASQTSLGFKIRTRALTTTMFARLFLSDLFVHGIGGGKYDEVTDVLFSRFLGMPAPSYVIATATLHLPFSLQPFTPDDCKRLARLRRDLWYNPQRHAPLDGPNLPADARELLRQKAELVAQAPAEPIERKRRFQAIRNVTERLRPFSVRELDAAGRDREACVQAVARNAPLVRRDYSFCFFPEHTLRDFFQHAMA